MDNFFRATQTKLKSVTQTNLLKKLLTHKQSRRNEKMALSSYTRASSWTKDKMLDGKTLQMLKEGALPLYHPDHFQYRVRTNDGNMHDQDVYVRKCVPSGQRAESISQDFKSSHLEHTLYQENQKNFLERSRIPEKEISPPPRYAARTENERITNTLNGPNRLIDPASSDPQMLWHPSWKDVNKKKWVSKKDFDLTMCTFRGKKCRDPWPTIVGGIHVGDQYIGGFDAVGNLSRNRTRGLEMGRKDFLTTVVPNHNSNPTSRKSVPIFQSDSIRKHTVAKFFGDADGSASKTKTYPKTLEQVVNKVDDAVYQKLTPTPIIRPQEIKPRAASVGPSKEPREPLPLPLPVKPKAPAVGLKQEKMPFRSASVTLRRNRTLVQGRSEYIKNTISSYFDNIDNDDDEIETKEANNADDANDSNDTKDADA